MAHDDDNAAAASAAAAGEEKKGRNKKRGARDLGKELEEEKPKKKVCASVGKNKGWKKEMWVGLWWACTDTAAPRGPPTPPLQLTPAEEAQEAARVNLLVHRIEMQCLEDPKESPHGPIAAHWREIQALSDRGWQKLLAELETMLRRQRRRAEKDARSRGDDVMVAAVAMAATQCSYDSTLALAHADEDSDDEGTGSDGGHDEGLFASELETVQETIGTIRGFWEAALEAQRAATELRLRTGRMLTLLTAMEVYETRDRQQLPTPGKELYDELLGGH